MGFKLSGTRLHEAASRFEDSHGSEHVRRGGGQDELEFDGDRA